MVDNNVKTKSLSRSAKRALAYRQRPATNPIPRSTGRGKGSPRYITVEAFKGGRKRMPANPPSTNNNPWAPIVLQKAFEFGTTTKTGLIDAYDVVKWLHVQLGSPFKIGGASGSSYLGTIKPQFCVRVREIRVWNLTGRTLGMVPYDYTSPDAAVETELDELGGWIDSGTVTDLPAIGYGWPLNISQHVITVQLTDAETGDTVTEGNRKVCKVVAVTGDKLIIHFHIDWRFPPIHTAGLTFDSLYQLQNKSYRQLTKMRLGLEKVYSSMPSTTPSLLGRAAVVMPSVPVITDNDPESPTPVERVIHDAAAITSDVQHIQSDSAKLNNDINELSSAGSSVSVINAAPSDEDYLVQKLVQLVVDRLKNGL